MKFLLALIEAFMGTFFGAGTRSADRYSSVNEKCEPCDDDDSEGMHMIQNRLDSY